MNLLYLLSLRHEAMCYFVLHRIIRAFDVLSVNTVIAKEAGFIRHIISWGEELQKGPM